MTRDDQADNAPRTGFPTTHWSLVLRASAQFSPASSEALEQLCRGYWYPLYVFARRQGAGPEEAQDLTQEFFSRLLSKNTLEMADPDRGRFRSFLLAAFKNMMANERRAAGRKKRGGGEIIFSLDEEDPEERFRLEPADPLTPEILFERRWAETVLSRVLNRLEIEYASQSVPFDALKGFLIDDRGASPFADLAERLGVTEAALKSLVYRMRRRYAQLFRDEIAQTVADPAGVDDEIRHLFAALSY